MLMQPFLLGAVINCKIKLSMAKSKYCYVIANEENGNMLVEDGKLPIYWNKKVAKERQLKFGSKWVVHKIELATMEKMVLSSKRA